MCDFTKISDKNVNSIVNQRFFYLKMNQVGKLMNTEINKVLLYFALKYNGDFDKIYSSLRTKEKFDVDEFMK